MPSGPTSPLGSTTYNSAGSQFGPLEIAWRGAITILYYAQYLALYLFYFKPKSLMTGRQTADRAAWFEQYNELFFPRPDFVYFKSDEGRLFFENRRYISSPSLEIGYEDGLISCLHTGGAAFNLGIEYDPGMLFKRPEYNTYAHRLGGSMCDLPFADNAVKTIVSIHVLDHVSNFERAIVELGRVLSPGGTLILSLFSEQMLRLHPPEWYARQHSLFNFWDRQQWQEFLARHGLTLVRLEGFTPSPLWPVEYFLGLRTLIPHHRSKAFSLLSIRAPALYRIAKTLLKDIARCIYLPSLPGSRADGPASTGYNYFLVIQKPASSQPGEDQGDSG